MDHPNSAWRFPPRRKLFALGCVSVVLAIFVLFKDFGFTATSGASPWSPPFHPPALEDTVVDGAGNHPYSPSHTGTTTVTATVTATHNVTLYPPTPTATQTVVETVTVFRNVTLTPEPVDFVLIMFSADSASEGAILMKSILMYNTHPTNFHIICDEPAQQYLEHRLALVTRPTHDVRVWFYRLSVDAMRARIDREGSIWTDHAAGLPGLMKLFMHEILPTSVTRAIYVDTDAFFISDPALLLRTFDAFAPDTLIMLPSHPEQSAPEWHDASKICSCVMLLHLARMREVRFMDSHTYRGTTPPALAPPAFRAMYGEPDAASGHFENVRLGDQGYFWAVASYYPDKFEDLKYDYEVTSCLLDMYLTGLGDDDATEEEDIKTQIHTWGTPQWQVEILPKLLHFNCLHGTPRYFEWPGWSDPSNSLAQRWGSAVAYHAGFKWVWLNTRDKTVPGPTLEVVTHVDAKFADELFEQQP